jgi:hypothetical protein
MRDHCTVADCHSVQAQYVAFTGSNLLGLLDLTSENCVFITSITLFTEAMQKYLLKGTVQPKRFG